VAAVEKEAFGDEMWHWKGWEAVSLGWEAAVGWGSVGLAATGLAAQASWEVAAG
jgi:hypothetical protein